MRRHWWQTLPVLLLSIGAAAPLVEAAQERLTAVVLRGASARPGSAPSGAASPLLPGVRVESPARMWTELAFSDGSSIVLEPGADFTLQGFGKNPRTGHLVIRGSGRGRLRVATSANVDVVIQTAGTEVEVVAATAVILAGPKGSAALISGKSVEVRRGDRDDILRRPGFGMAFEDGSVQRLSPQQLTEALDSFAPVAMGGGPANAVLVAEAGATTAPATAGNLTPLDPNNTVTGLRTPNQQSSGGNPSGGGIGPNGGGELPPSPPPPPQPPPPIPPQPQPRQSVAWQLAENNLSYGPTSGSGIAAPQSGFSTSSINGNNIFNTNDINAQKANIGAADPPLADGFIASIAGLKSDESPDLSGGSSQFGSGRVRRFSRDGSGFTIPRSDTGMVTLPGDSTPRPIGSLFQNISGNTGALNTNRPLYDAVANVGVVSLLILTPLTSAQSNALSGFSSDGHSTILGLPMIDQGVYLGFNTMS